MERKKITYSDLKAVQKILQQQAIKPRTMKPTNEMCEEAFRGLPIEVKRAIVLIFDEYERAVNKFPVFPRDPVTCAAIVCEESGELIRAALQFKYEGGRFYDMHIEAVQAGAMALRFLVNFQEITHESINNLRDNSLTKKQK